MVSAKPLQSFYNGVTKHSNTIVIALLCLACLGVVIYHRITLTQFPPVLIDEPWYANTAWNWLINGKNFDTMHAGARDSAMWPYLGNFPLLVSFKFFGLGLLQARTVSWFFGTLLLLATALVGRKLYGTLTGVLSALLLSISNPYLWSSHYYRPDVMLLSISMFCFLLVLIALEKEKWWAHFLAGALISLSVDIHQNALFFALGFGSLYLYHYRKNILRERGTWLFILGVLLGVFYYLFFVVLPHQSDFVNFYGFTLGTTHQLPLLTFNPLAILKSARAEIGRYRFFENSLDFAVIVASIIYLSFRRRGGDRSLLIYTATLFACFVLLVGNKEFEYAIYLYPNFMLIVAASMIGLIERGDKPTLHRAFLIPLYCMLIFSTSYYMYQSVSSHQGYDYDASVAKIKENIPEDARVMGMPEWWLGFYDRDYRSINSLTYLHFLKGYSLTEGLIELKPDYLIVDNEIRRRLVVEDYFKNEGFEVYNMPKLEFEEFLAEYGNEVDQYFIPWHGVIEIYALNWDEG